MSEYFVIGCLSTVKVDFKECKFTIDNNEFVDIGLFSVEREGDRKVLYEYWHSYYNNTVNLSPKTGDLKTTAVWFFYYYDLRPMVSCTKNFGLIHRKFSGNKIYICNKY